MIKYLKYLCFIFFLFLCNFGFVSANESYDYTYIGKGEYGNKIAHITPYIFNLQDKNGNTFNTYCIDYNYLIEPEWTYSLINVDDASFLDKSVTDKIRNVVINSYPFETLENIRVKSGISDLTINEAITATQSALWYYANNYTFYLTENNKKLYDYYLSLDDSPTSSTDIATIDIDYHTSLVEGQLQTLITYSSNDAFDLEYSFDEDFLNNPDISIEKQENGVLVKNIKEDSSFTVYVTGKQNINKDVYFYNPNGGRTASQSLIGVTSDLINVKASKQINIDENILYSLTISKIDANSLEVLPNAIFQISNTSDFSSFVYERVTDEFGQIVLNDIPNGTWYIKEIKSPLDYGRTNEIFSVIINNKDESITIPNEKTGKLTIKKIDSENNQILEGAKIGIFTDEEATDLFREITTTTEELIIRDLPINTYYIKEIKAPDGYITNNEIYKIEIEEDNTIDLTILNHRIYKTSLNSHFNIVIGTLLLSFFTLLYLLSDLWLKKERF